MHLKMILLDCQNYVRWSSKASHSTKNFNILETNLSILHIYFDLTKFQIYLDNILNILACSFYIKLFKKVLFLEKDIRLQ